MAGVEAESRVGCDCTESRYRIKNPRGVLDGEYGFYDEAGARVGAGGTDPRHNETGGRFGAGGTDPRRNEAGARFGAGGTDPREPYNAFVHLIGWGSRDAKYVACRRDPPF